MRFDYRVIKPYQEAVTRIPGTNGAGIGAGPNGNQPTLNINTTTQSDAEFVDALVEDRIGIFKVDIQAIGEVKAFAAAAQDMRTHHEKLGAAKEAIAKLPGVEGVTSDEHRLVVQTEGNEKSEFLSKLLEDNIYGKDVYFRS